MKILYDNSKEFSLPGKKELLDSSFNNRDVVVDIMDYSLEQSIKKQKSFYKGFVREQNFYFDKNKLILIII